MENVKILKNIYVEQTGLQYKEGEEREVPKAVAARHEKSGFMEIVKPPKVKLDKEKTV
jgi:hypothetical protein